MQKITAQQFILILQHNFQLLNTLNPSLIFYFFDEKNLFH